MRGNETRFIRAENDVDKNVLKNTFRQGSAMMGAAMLKRHRFVRSLWASYGVPFGLNVYPGESGAALDIHNNFCPSIT